MLRGKHPRGRIDELQRAVLKTLQARGRNCRGSKVNATNLSETVKRHQRHVALRICERDVIARRKVVME